MACQGVLHIFFWFYAYTLLGTRKPRFSYSSFVFRPFRRKHDGQIQKAVFKECVLFLMILSRVCECAPRFNISTISLSLLFFYCSFYLQPSMESMQAAAVDIFSSSEREHASHYSKHWLQNIDLHFLWFPPEVSNHFCQTLCSLLYICCNIYNTRYYVHNLLKSKCSHEALAKRREQLFGKTWFLCMGMMPLLFAQRCVDCRCQIV